MKFEFISNACGIFTSESGVKILTDPWLVDGVFEGSWCHFHKLNTKTSDLQDVDAIYLSHIHPDHYDDRFFDFRKDMPIFLLDSRTNFLIKKLSNSGHSNLVLIKNGQTLPFKDFKITLFSPFVKNNFHDTDAKVGKVIDSAMIIESNGIIAFNANDNTPDIKACRIIKDRCGHVDLLMHNYNSAGPYPACFNNLSIDQKQEEHKKNLIRNFEYMYRNIQEMKPRFTLPFAGAYVLGGSLHIKNTYLGTTTWDECANYLKSKGDIETQVICLRENDIFDIRTGISDKEYVPIDVNQMERYISVELSKIEYPYETDERPDLDILAADVNKASHLMKERASRLGIKPDSNVTINFSEKSIEIVKIEDPKSTLQCYVDDRLLRCILDKKSHWNNAEIGCHIEFVRTPNHYSPDLHTMLQFLHL